MVKRPRCPLIRHHGSIDGAALTLDPGLADHGIEAVDLALAHFGRPNTDAVPDAAGIGRNIAAAGLASAETETPRALPRAGDRTRAVLQRKALWRIEPQPQPRVAETSAADDALFGIVVIRHAVDGIEKGIAIGGTARCARDGGGFPADTSDTVSIGRMRRQPGRGFAPALP